MNPKPDPEYSEAVKQWADEMGAMSKQQPEAFDPKEMQKVQNDIDSVNAGATIDRAKLLNLPDLKQLLFDVQQVMAGYSQDDTWSEWDESVRKRVVNAQYLFESPPTPEGKPREVVEAAKEATPLEKQLVQLFSVSGQMNVLDVVKYVKGLQDLLKFDDCPDILIQHPYIFLTGKEKETSEETKQWAELVIARYEAKTESEKQLAKVTSLVEAAEQSSREYANNLFPGGGVTDVAKAAQHFENGFIAGTQWSSGGGDQD